MGFDLKPRNSKLNWFHFGAFSWSWMLNEGVGLVIGQGKSKDPGSFSYQPDKKGRCPNYNDGFMVTAFQAKAMSLAAYGLVSKYKFINKEWNAISKEKREELEKDNSISGMHRGLYVSSVREDFLEKVEKFAEWAVESRGFGVY